MLDASALGQLKGLKKQIHDSVPRIEGIVKGTRKRFGFVTAADKEDYLLPQSEMERVLPGDKVQCILEKGQKDGDKPIAKIEKFISSSLDYFIGTVKEKNNQLYVLPDHPQLTRWIFIPPKHRKHIADGDLVSAKIIQHPFNNKGRTQAEISYVIGKPDDPFIEHRFAIAKYHLPEKIWQNDELEAVRITGEQVLQNNLPENLSEGSLSRSDLRHQCFITIDGSNTQDLDDALAIKSLDSGWQLSIAIADASQFIEPNSPLDRIARQQMCTIYLPGQKVPMLPDVLSSNICSLKEGEDRLTLVCQLTISVNGDIESCSYEQAVIKSQGKLSYDDVAHFIDNNDVSLFNDDIRTSLRALHQLTLARKAWREQKAITPEDYADFRLSLNDRGKITAIERGKRNIAQRLVEESMLACNQATAEYLDKNGEHGLFIGSQGFKTEQIPGVKKLINEHITSFVEHIDKLDGIDGYLHLTKHAAQANSELALQDILKKKLQRSEWHSTKKPHYGLGFSGYTTFTSPIRKYSDLLVHRMIKRILNGKTVKPLNSELLEKINTLNNDVRGAQRDCELSLKCQYLENFKGQQFQGEISMINHRTIGVYLPQFDVHGHIEVRSLNEEYSFKQESLQLITKTLNLKIKQTVSVTIENIDSKQRTIVLAFSANDNAEDKNSDKKA